MTTSANIILNLQDRVSVDTKELRAFNARLRSIVTEASERRWTVAIVPDDRMLELNASFRGKDVTTDVLSFPHEPDEFDPDEDNLGDIVISADQALRQSRDNDLPLIVEIKQLMLHGVLHLCGYDHETDDGEMNARELDLREQIGI